MSEMAVMNPKCYKSVNLEGKIAISSVETVHLFGGQAQITSVQFEHQALGALKDQIQLGLRLASVRCRLVREYFSEYLLR
jgi:hypothetical protein